MGWCGVVCGRDAHAHGPRRRRHPCPTWQRANAQARRRARGHTVAPLVSGVYGACNPQPTEGSQTEGANAPSAETRIEPAAGRRQHEAREGQAGIGQ